MLDEKKLSPQEEAELFRFVGDEDYTSAEKIVAPRYSYWKSVFRIFFKKKINIVLLVILALVLLSSYLLPCFFTYDMFENVTDAKTFNLNPAKATEFFGGWSFKWMLGTGPMGNSIFYGIFASARMSLTLSFVCATINMTVGILMGAAWGYSKKLDVIMLVVYQIIANVPSLLTLAVLVYVVGAGFWSFVFALTITGWLGIAYFFRTQVMIIRDREYAMASRCLGTRIPRMIAKNILPFLTSVIVTLLATELPGYISSEVYLSYIGIGLSATVPSLGRMISQAQSAFLTYPWEFWPPVAVSAIVTMVLYLLGQNLADASDPRTHMS